MLTPDQVLNLQLTAGEVQVVMAGLGELAFRISAPVVDKIRTQLLAVDPEAFGVAPQQQPTTVVRQSLNGAEI